MNATRPAAIVIDQWEILRLGVEKVLSDLDFLVSGSTGKAEDGILLARSSVAELLIVGRAPDLKRNRVLSAAQREKTHGKRLDVLFLLDAASPEEVNSLIEGGASGALLRSCGAAELSLGIRSIRNGGKATSAEFTPGAIGRLKGTGTTASGLSPKELEVLVQLATGATYDQIAARLVITKATVKTHLVHVYEKLEVSNRNEAVTKAVALGLLA